MATQDTKHDAQKKQRPDIEELLKLIEHDTEALELVARLIKTLALRSPPR